jgi:hypothetical protein
VPGPNSNCFQKNFFSKLFSIFSLKNFQKRTSTRFFETQVAVENNEIINYISKSNLDQAIEVLETFYNNITTSQPNLLNKISSPYNSSFVDNFKINTVSLNNDKPDCKICKIKVLKMYMRSHVAKHILLGHTTGQVCGFCGVLHPGNVSKEKTRNNNYKPAVFCPGYYYEFSYNAVIKITKSNPSSNGPEKCRVCSTYLWSHNMLSHFQDNNHGVPCDFLIIEDEKEAVLNFKTGFKNQVKIIKYFF